MRKEKPPKIVWSQCDPKKMPKGTFSDETLRLNYKGLRMGMTQVGTLGDFRIAVSLASPDRRLPVCIAITRYDRVGYVRSIRTMFYKNLRAAYKDADRQVTIAALMVL